MRHIRIAALSGAVVAGLSVLVAPAAPADTENCVSHSEVDNYVDGLTRTQVWNRFDIYGDATGSTADGDGYKVNYTPTCWAPDSRRVVVAFDYSSGGSIWLDVRDM